MQKPSLEVHFLQCVVPVPIAASVLFPHLISFACYLSQIVPHVPSEVTSDIEVPNNRNNGSGQQVTLFSCSPFLIILKYYVFQGSSFHS
jgi:hypothetical protein